MRVLIACETSGVVREAFRKKGHDAWSCDILPADEYSPFHYLGDVVPILDGWDMIIGFPPCTYLCGSGMHWTTRGLRDPQLTEDALDLVQAILNADAPRIALENPIGIISSRIRKPDQIIQPYDYGEDSSKRTCLWLKGLPPLPLDPSKFVEPRIVDGKKRWGNQTDSGQNRLGPSEDRWKLRSKTYQGIANAMADAWG